jgi:hypothetical protein
MTTKGYMYKRACHKSILRATAYITTDHVLCNQTWLPHRQHFKSNYKLQEGYIEISFVSIDSYGVSPQRFSLASCRSDFKRWTAKCQCSHFQAIAFQDIQQRLFIKIGAMRCCTFPFFSSIAFSKPVLVSWKVEISGNSDLVNYMVKVLAKVLSKVPLVIDIPLTCSYV